MICQVKTKLRDQIDRAINDCASGSVSRRRRGVESLCQIIARESVPEIHVSVARTVEPKPVGPVACPPVGQQPPKRKRIVDPAAITAFNKTHPVCAVAGDDCDGPLDFSHIKARSAGGDDSEENGLRQCRRHHSVWHRSKPIWCRRFGARLTNEDHKKVLAVYPTLAEYLTPLPPATARGTVGTMAGDAAAEEVSGS